MPEEKTKKPFQTKPVRLDWMGIQELACAMLGIDYDDAINEGEIDIDGKFYDEFEVDIDQFQKIVEHLITIADCGRSPLTETLYQGFSKPVDGVENAREWIIRHQPNK